MPRIYFFYILFYFCLNSVYAQESSEVKAQEAMKAIDLFKTYITGDFDNTRQITQEKEDGKQVHPYAKHVNRVADTKIKNLPADLNGFFLLEESYYKYPDKDTILKPYLFLFEETKDGKVRLTNMQLPEGIELAAVRNDNDTLSFDYQTLKSSPSFKPAIYQQTEAGFYLHAPNDLPGGMHFTLEETIGPEQLIVMELVEKNGKRLTPYAEPIIYDRLD